MTICQWNLPPGRHRDEMSFLVAGRDAKSEKVNMNGVEISNDFRVWFVGVEGSANIGGIQWVAVGERVGHTLSYFVALQISQDR